MFDPYPEWVYLFVGDAVASPAEYPEAELTQASVPRTQAVEGGTASLCASNAAMIARMRRATRKLVGSRPQEVERSEDAWDLF